jgi:hypothetical protein
LADQASHRIGDGERKLLTQPVGERGFGGNERFEIIISVLATARAGAGPFRISGWRLRGPWPDRLVLVGRSVVEAVVDALVFGRGVALEFMAVERLAVDLRLVR